MKSIISYLTLFACGILFLPLSSHAQLITAGLETQANTTTANPQQWPATAMDANGNFVVAWESYGQEGTTYGIYCQRFDNTGTPLGAEFRANTTTNNDQRFPAVAMDALGNFVVVWQSYGHDGDGWGIYGQRFDNTGTAIGVQFLVNTTTAGQQRLPRVDMDDIGRFTVVWDSEFEIVAQRFDASGTAIGGELAVNTTTAGAQSYPDVALDADGDLVIVWQSLGQDGDGFGVYGQRYDNTGAVQGGEFLVNTTTANNQLSPRVGMDASGNFVAVWVSNAQDGDREGIYGQRFDNTGTAQGSEFLVNTATGGPQDNPEVAMGATGAFLVVWNSYTQDGDRFGVFAQAYDIGGGANGVETLINVTTSNFQQFAAIALWQDDAVIAWQDGERDGASGQDGDDYGIFYQGARLACDPPEALCMNYTVSLDATGNVTITVGDIDAGSTADCFVQSITLSETAFDCSDVGSQTVTLTITDVAGNSDNCTATVKIVDDTDPTIGCPADITVDNDAGQCSAVVTYASPTTADNCPGEMLGQDAGLASGSAFPVGTTTNTFTVTDASSNTASCSFAVTVNDAEDPTISCPADIVVGNDASQCSAIVNYAVTSGDNCPTGGSMSQDAGLASGSVFPLGTMTNTFTVSDGAGNTASCSFNVTVNDTENPSIVCPGDIVANNDAGNCSAVVTYTPPTGIDNCPGASTAQTTGLGSGATFPVGTTVEAYQVTDGAGNMANCSFNITVNDAEDPTIVCPADITVGNDAGQCSAVVSYTAPTGTDNCPGATTALSSGLGSGGTFPVGTSVETYTVTDAAGNTANCSFNITVNDTEDPVIACPADITVSNDAGQCSAAVNYTAPTGTDNCSGATTSLSSGLGSGGTFPVGTSVETYTVTDAAGNTTNCSFNITVNDTEDPTIACPADITVDNDAGQCSAVVGYTAPTGTDNCPGATTILSSGLGSGGTFPVGTSVETYTVTDAAGNTANCSFNITVNDTEDPTIACPTDITVNGDAGQCSAVVSYTAPTGTDNCSGATTALSSDLGSGGTFPVGTSVEMYTVTDAAGNTASCSFNITVNDAEDPTISCPADITVSNDAGVCGAVVNYSLPVFDDNCALVSADDVVEYNGHYYLLVEPTLNWVNAKAAAEALGGHLVVINDAAENAFVYSLISQNIWIGLTDLAVEGVFEWVNGDPLIYTNWAPGEPNNTLGDEEYTEMLVTSGQWNDNWIGAKRSYVVEFTTNPVPVLTLTSGLGNGATFPVGTSTETYSVTDPAGNTASCSFNITVNDTEAPTVACPTDITVGNDAGQCSAVVDYALPTVSDNCSPYFQYGDHYYLLVESLLNWVNAKAAAEALGGHLVVINDAAENAFVYSLISQNTWIGLTDLAVEGVFEWVNGDPLIYTDWATGEPNNNLGDEEYVEMLVVDGQWNDAWIGAKRHYMVEFSSHPYLSLTSGLGSGGVFPLGTSTETYTVTDAAGNSASCSFTVTVNDTEDPVISCPSDITVNNEMGTCGANMEYAAPSYSDNCGSVTIALTGGIGNSSFFPVGSTTEEYTATDAAGNTASCSFTVTVNDTEDPEIACPADITVSNDPGQCSAVVNYMSPSGMDNCPGAILVQTTGLGGGSSFPVGSTTETYQVTDAAGNTISCSFTVTVNDTQNPAIACPADFTVSNDAGQCSAVVLYEIPLGSDNCPGAATAQTGGLGSGSAFPIGATTNTFEVTDAAGNTASCSFTITVKDTQNPAIACPADIVTDNDVDQCSAVVNYLAPTGTDNCPGATTVQTVGLGSGSAFPVGTTTETFTVADAAGNMASCSFTVTVNDAQDPDISCSPDIVVDNATDLCGAYLEYGAPSYSDNCPGVTIALTAGIGNTSFFPVGATTEEYTATDAAGNTASCSFTVTVIDNQAPTIACPADISVDNDAGECGADVTVPLPVITSDNCLIMEEDFNAGALPAGWSNNAVGTNATATWSFGVDTEGPLINGTGSIDGTNMAFFDDDDFDTDGGEAVELISPAVDLTGYSSVLLTFDYIYWHLNTSYFKVEVWDGVAWQTILLVDNDQVHNVLVNGAFDVSAYLNSAFQIRFTYDDGGEWAWSVAVDNIALYGASVSNDQTSNAAASGFYPVGTTTVNYTVTDLAGNSTTCSLDVTVNDAEDPTISCPVDINAIATSSAGATVNYSTPSGSDNCPGATTIQTLGLASGATFPIGTTTNTFLVTDAAGNTASCSFDVTIVGVAPEIVCPADLTVDNDAGQCSAVVNFSATETVGIPASTITYSHAPGSVFPVGTTTVTATATNAVGSSSCSFDITVLDAEDPAIVCPADISVSNDAGQCSAVVLYEIPLGADNCPGASTAQTGGLGSNSAFPVGTTTETYTVTDAAGNTASCSFDITVNDTEDPVISCPVSLLHDNDAGLCSANVLYDVTATDNCPGVTVALNSGLPSGSDFPVGVTISSYTATDAAGNTASCNVKIIVNDAENPQIICPADVTVGNDAGLCSAVVNYVAPTGLDNCPGATTALTGGLGSGSAFPVGMTTETYTVTDVAGNTASCSFDITVNDTENPTIACPSDVTVGNDAGLCSAVVNYVAPTGLDNCPGATTALTGGLGSGSAFPVGMTTETYTVTDVAGNTANCSFDITVNDTENPTIACPADITVSNDAGLCSAIVSYTVTYGDNCPGESLAQNSGLVSAAAFPIGTTTNGFTVTDAAGNTAGCSFTVTVNDTEDPTIACPADMTVGNDAGQCGAAVIYTVTFGDNCPGETLAQTAGIGSGLFFPLGTTTNNFTVTDAAGNTAGCSFTVTVNDTEDPTINCPADITADNDLDQCGAIVNYAMGYGDNCPAATLAQTAGLAGGSFFPLGTTTNSFTVTDAVGQTASCSFTITVVDGQAPYINCPADIMVDNETDLCSAVVSFSVTASDNCPGVGTFIQTGGLWSGTAFPVGTTTNTFQVTDAAGNTSSCSFDVTVLDVQQPIVECNDGEVTVELDATGQGTLNLGGQALQVWDNCASYQDLIASAVAAEANYDCSDVGQQSTTVTVNDGSGNSASCVLSFAVVDFVAPDAQCQDVTIQLNGNGVAGVTVGDIDAGSSDACGIQSMVLDEQNFNCYEAGDNTVTLTVMDVNGNMSSCTATVTVLDAAGPDDDCDGVSNVCDECPGGDDSIDMNNDGLPDCAYPPPYELIFGSWKCANNKVYVCHNGITKCINKNALAAHIAHGDYLGPCDNAECDGLQAEGLVIDPQGDVAWHGHEHEHETVLTAYPNPFLQEVTIGFWLPQEEVIRLEVYDLSGKLVRELQSGYAFAGEQQVIWNGRGPGGQLIEPGVYVLRLQTSQGVLTKQLTLIR